MTHRRLTLDVSRNGITHLGGLELHAWSVDGRGRRPTTRRVTRTWVGRVLFCFVPCFRLSLCSPLCSMCPLLCVSFAFCVFPALRSFAISPVCVPLSYPLVLCFLPVPSLFLLCFWVSWSFPLFPFVFLPLPGLCCV